MTAFRFVFMVKATICIVLTTAIRLPAHGDLVDSIDTRYHKPLGESVDRGLEYLAANQSGNGSFSTRHSETVAALGIMAFLAGGHTPGLGPYGDVINRAIDHVLDSQRNDGMLASDGRMYGHSIATLMLAEVTGMLDPQRQERADKVLDAAIKLLLDAQRIEKSPPLQGGWRYQPTSADSDLSLSGWAFMAVWAARNAGYPVPREVIDDAVAYIMRSHNRRDGGFAYMIGRNTSARLVGLGALCLILADEHPDTVDRAAQYIASNGFSSGRFYYQVYYNSQAMFQLGGEYWEHYAPRLYEAILERQKPDGSFESDGSVIGLCGVRYSTTMAILSLTPTFRQLPVYQR